METFRLGRAGGAESVDYFVRADTVTQAREFVSRVVPDAAAATNNTLFYCIPDRTRTPPLGTVVGTNGKMWTLS